MNKLLFCLLFIFIAFLIVALKPISDRQQLIDWGNRCLNQSYDPAADKKLKKYELGITGDLFVRLRKTYQNGKQEYFSFQIKRFADISYLGNTSLGTLRFETNASDIIVQTHRDPKGNVDSMGHSFNIPVKNMQPERLDSLRNTLLQLRDGE